MRKRMPGFECAPAASVATGIFHANLLAEEIDLEEQITH